MAKTNYFINIGASRWYSFWAPTGSYTEALGIALGVGVSIPAGHRATSIGTFADYGIMRVRIKLDDKTSIVRLCDADMLQTAITDLPGATYFGAKVLDVTPVRKNVLI